MRLEIDMLIGSSGGLLAIIFSRHSLHHGSGLPHHHDITPSMVQLRTNKTFVPPPSADHLNPSPSCLPETPFRKKQLYISRPFPFPLYHSPLSPSPLLRPHRSCLLAGLLAPTPINIFFSVNEYYLHLGPVNKSFPFFFPHQPIFDPTFASFVFDICLVAPQVFCFIALKVSLKRKRKRESKREREGEYKGEWGRGKVNYIMQSCA
jgi:hypothetical protein